MNGNSHVLRSRISPLDQGIGPLEQPDCALGRSLPTQAQQSCRPRRQLNEAFRAGRPLPGSENVPVELAEDGNGGRNHQGVLAVCGCRCCLGPRRPACRNQVFKPGPWRRLDACGASFRDRRKEVWVP